MLQFIKNSVEGEDQELDELAKKSETDPVEPKEELVKTMDDPVKDYDYYLKKYTKEKPEVTIKDLPQLSQVIMSSPSTFIPRFSVRVMGAVVWDLAATFHVFSISFG